MIQLGSILLIDDSESDNFIHRRRLQKMQLARQIDVRTNGREGLDFLTTPLANGRYPRPDLVFLDINMPILDGWGFLDAYQQLPPEQRARVTVVMLGSVDTDPARARAASYAIIDEQMSKPLEQAGIEGLVRRYFAD